MLELMSGRTAPNQPARQVAGSISPGVIPRHGQQPSASSATGAHEGGVLGEGTVVD